MDLRNDSETIKILKENKSSPITTEEGIKFAKEFGAAGYIETSSLKGIGVKQVFELMIDVTIGVPKEKVKKECIIQ
jgi:GTPase SAR1 family protein